MIYNSKIKWDKAYDVIIIGFGGAGASAARFAADKNAKVLLIDSAPEEHIGGNTRYAGGAFAWGDNFEKLKDYYVQTYYPFKYDPEGLNPFVRNVLQMKDYSKKYFGIDAVATGRRPNGEYPEYRNGDAMQSQSLTQGMYNGGFWKLLRSKVFERLNLIDVWYKTDVLNLIQDAESKTVLGIKVKRQNQVRYIAAKNGVVLSCGGYENNQDMIQTYLGEGSLAPIGTLYNKGRGIDLASEVGARLWHMSNYDSHGLSLRNNDLREKYAYMINWPSLFNGSIFVAGDDGTRYFREDEEDRHGYKYNHGNWIMIPSQNHPHIILDQTQFDQLNNDQSKNAKDIKDLLSYAIEAQSLEELSKKIDAPMLKQAVSDYNFLTDQVKRDMFLNRDLKTMRSFDDGPYYAIPVRHNILHTHGGAKRNAKCEVIDLEGNVIPDLYEAGELGDIFATKYIGANSIADLLISGKIAGENAAEPKRKIFEFETINSDAKELESDAKISELDFAVGKNQGLGISTNGISDQPIVVRVTLNNNKKIKGIETLSHNETASLGGKAIPLLTREIIEKQSTDVDAISGASVTSRAFVDAVKSACKKANA
ncbi:FAD-binding protein [Lactobacillus gigeriorum]|uniref:Urocanate reductase n=1 Tax=Lactobacillus gigeriorum DSM 23908 = CRBIP 24.85 TaxID=1423751 RepID=I7KNV2_9LACO|nr:FAD-binding protein [Lactobacillus gigeriorum]KRN11868.1 succinate dehydrogenase fumarate reductase [Lactobacillus gigeriorum DSM 23908 = CRBIP 24.85]CCI86929.1 Succinate dehydrogenase/fumarate reductase [Lactobacillus gigeriorum DSM 23908 = CRBIP 24.85]